MKKRKRITTTKTTTRSGKEPKKFTLPQIQGRLKFVEKQIAKNKKEIEELEHLVNADNATIMSSGFRNRSALEGRLKTLHEVLGFFNKSRENLIRLKESKVQKRGE